MEVHEAVHLRIPTPILSTSTTQIQIQIIIIICKNVFLNKY